MHARSLPFRQLLRCLSFLFAFFLLCPAQARAEPEDASAPAGTEAVAPPPAVQEALQSVVEQTSAPAMAEEPSVQTAAALPGTPREAEAESLAAPSELPLNMAWYLDPKGALSLADILASDRQKAFTPYEPESLPHHAGTLWLRLAPTGKTPATPLVLDLNTRIAGQLPGIPQVWLARPGEKNGTPVRPTSEGLYPLPNPLPEQTDIYIRVNGLPAPGFVPLLRTLSSLTIVDDLGTQPPLVLLGVLLFICLLRGVAERREWRMWAALYIAAVWVQAFWGLPTTPAGEVSRWDMPGLLAPGVALLILPHVGRHMMRTRLHAPLIDMQFVLLALLGILISVAPLIPGYTWTLQFLPLWPLFMLLLLPGTLAACLRRLPGAKRFLFICLLPPLGMLALVPLSRLLPGWLIELLPDSLDGVMTPGVVSLIPLTFLTLSALVAALSKSPKLLPAPNRSSREMLKTGKAGVAALELGGFPEPARPTLERLPDLSSAPEGLEIASFPAQAARVADAPVLSVPRKAPHPQALETPLSAGMVEDALRAPLDALLRAVTAVDQTFLPGEARRRAGMLDVAARNLATAIGTMGAPSAPEPSHDEPFDLNQLLLETHEAVASLAESKNLGLSWFTAPHLSRCYEGKRAQLAQVLALLVESAVLATERGMVQIRAQRVPESTDPGHLLFTVSDTGAGTPPLGRSTLAFIRAWELSGPEGGDLSLESGPKGTTVSFSIRLTAHMNEQPRPAAPENETLPDKARSPASALRIIVVSGVPANRQMLSFYLDELPHEIVEARSPEEARKIYRRAPAALLIFDDDMPEEAIGGAVGAIRVFEGEHNFPLASILALVNNEEQIEALRRAGCTHFLPKPVTRKDLRILALRLAPVMRRPREEKQPVAEEKPLPKEKPAIADLPDLPAPAPRREEPAPSAPAKPGLLASLLAPFQKKTTPGAAEKEETLVLTEKAPEKPVKLSSVGEPMPISKADALPMRQPNRPNPLEERAKHTPSRSNAPENATEWVGDPMPISKKKKTDETSAPASIPESAVPETEASRSGVPLTESAPLLETPEATDKPLPPEQAEETKAAFAETLPLPEAGAPRKADAPPLKADEWVGGPMPVSKPLSLDAEPLTLGGAAPCAAPEATDAPLELGEPLIQDMEKPLSFTELDLNASEREGIGTGETLPLPEPNGTASDEAVITLTETVGRAARTGAPTPQPSLPDLFGDHPSAPSAPCDPLLEEAARLTPCEQRSRPVASDTLDIEDIVELSEPVAASAPAEKADPERTQEKAPDNGPQDEASDEAIRTLLAELDAALGQAVRGEQAGDVQAVCEAAGHIGRVAEKYDLRVLDDPARCLEEAACAGKMTEVRQLMPDLVAAINRNRASFEEK